MRSSLVLLLLLASCTASQQQRLQEQLAPAELSYELRNRHFAEDALRDPPGNFDFEIESSSHVIPTQFGSLPLMIAKAEGLPPGEQFLLASVDPLTKKVTPHCDVIASADGELEIIDQRRREQANNVPIVIKDCLKGQNMWLAAISRERNTCTLASYVFSPLEERVGDAEFSLRTTHRKGTHFNLEGKGLSPGEPVVVFDRSDKRVRKHLLTANAQGRVLLQVEPIVFGKVGGSASLQIKRGLLEEQIAYSWGTKLVQESREFYPVLFVANHSVDQVDVAALQDKVQRQLFL